ncbi:MAG: DMT family transporter [Pseudomonadota bacterium]
MHHALIMMAAGIGIPVLAALNAALGRHIGAPAPAAMILFCVAFLTAGLITALTGPGALKGVASAPRHVFLAGVLIAFYVLSITWIAPVFGVGNAVLFVLLGQLISATAIDHFGLFGAQVTPLTLQRGAGIALMAFGALLTQRV